MTPYEWLTRAVTGANERERGAKEGVRRATREDMPAALRELANAIENADRITRAAWVAGRRDFGPGSRITFVDAITGRRGNTGTVLSIGNSGDLRVTLDGNATPDAVSLDEFVRDCIVEPPHAAHANGGHHGS